jgi:geranylgeranyl pyrophosphate synthase
MGCEQVGGRRENALGAAAAVELVHAYSLVHDDLPCMDDATLRRGKPCAHVVYGEAMGVLAGDALLTLAFELLARHTPAGAPLAEMTVALGEAAGWDGMVGGQVADLAAEGQAPDLERVHRIHTGKTAAMISVSVRLGALVGGGAADRVNQLAEAGRDLGLAFQIVDDLLDVEGTTEALGKQAGADAERDKMTWPAVVGVEQARKDARDLVDSVTARCAEGGAAELFTDLGAFLLPRTA